MQIINISILHPSKYSQWVVGKQDNYISKFVLFVPRTYNIITAFCLIRIIGYSPFCGNASYLLIGFNRFSLGKVRLYWVR